MMFRTSRRSSTPDSPTERGERERLGKQCAVDSGSEQGRLGAVGVVVVPEVQDEQGVFRVGGDVGESLAGTRVRAAEDKGRLAERRADVGPRPIHCAPGGQGVPHGPVLGLRQHAVEGEPTTAVGELGVDGRGVRIAGRVLGEQRPEDALDSVRVPRAALGESGLFLLPGSGVVFDHEQMVHQEPDGSVEVAVCRRAAQDAAQLVDEVGPYLIG